MSFEQIYNEYFKIIYSYIITRVRDESTAQDLAAITWRKVLSKLHTFDENKGNIRQWLFGVARNETNMHHRLYYVRKFFSLNDYEDTTPAPGKDIDQKLIDDQEKADLLGAMAKFKSKERDILALKFYSGLNNKQIAEVAGISQSNTGVILSRGISKLRVFLEAK